MRNSVVIAGALVLAVLAYLFWPSREAVPPPSDGAATQGQTDE